MATTRPHRNLRRTWTITLLVVLGASLNGCERGAEKPALEIEATTRREIDQGALVGVRGRYGNQAWLGIPYAEPPLGDLRWHAPQEPRPWEGEYRASQTPPPCPQLGSPFAGVVDVEPGTPAGREDCLYLNVYAPPETAAGAALPVLFWIHGGGNVIGQIGFYDGGNLASSENVVVVTAQYRLGPLGWFRHPALRVGAGPLDQSGNFGTLDLIRALEWVRDNIAVFGGDPQRVTIFGESAGARNVISLLLSPPANGLFHGAIAQSGGTSILTPAQAENYSDADPPGWQGSSGEALLALVQRDSLAGDRAAAKLYLEAQSDEQLAAYLRSKRPEELLRAYQTDPTEGLIRVANVFGDGVVIAEGDALQNLSAGRGAAVPAIFGTNRDEQKIFLFADPRWTKRWLGILPRTRDPELYDAAAETLSRLWAVRGAVEPATARLAAGQPSYVYRWDWDEEPTVLGSDLSRMIGAAHGLEIPFVFGHFYLGPEGERIFADKDADARTSLSRAMMSYWASFARSGTPSGGRDSGLPIWPQWQASPEVDRLLIFDTTADGGIRAGAEVPQREEIFADLSTDTRADSPERRCRVYATVMEWTDEIDAARYQELGCGEY